MPKRQTKTHQYSINVHQSLMKTFLGKHQVLDINNKWNKVTIKIHPPQPTEQDKEKNENTGFFKVVIEGKHRGSVRECSRELVTRYQKMCNVIQNIMKNQTVLEDTDNSENIELEIIDDK